MKVKRLLLLVLLSIIVGSMYAQQPVSSGYIVDYSKPQEYVVGGIKVEGVQFQGQQQILAIAGLKEGMTIVIPSGQTSEIINKVWAQKHFSDVSLNIDSMSSGRDTVYLGPCPERAPQGIEVEFSGSKEF